MTALKNVRRESSTLNLFTRRAFLPWLSAGCILLLAQVSGQDFTNLYRFTPVNTAFLNADGAYPVAGMVLLSNTLYGASSQGGNAGGGTIFKVQIDGTGFKVLYSLTPANPNTGAAGDGAYPLGSLLAFGNQLYGTTSAGGAGNDGIVFKLNLDGTGFTTLHAFSASDPNTFANSDGAAPWAGLMLAGSTLYGTASRGGDAGSGTIFKLNTDGTGFTRLHSFSALDPTTQTNADGAYPLGGLLLSGTTLYGTAYRGGSAATGTVFRVNTDGTGFTVLHNADGGPRSGLVLAGNVLYGTTEAGGSAGGGTVFALKTDGTGFTNLQNFIGAPGAGPWGGLALSSNTLYGTTFAGGDAGEGSVFAINVDGTGFSSLYSFTGGSDGAQPEDTLLSAGGVLYGTASGGGNAGSGTVFRVSASTATTGPLKITLFGNEVVLTWPASTTGLTLQSAASLVPPVVWAPVSPAPTVINGQNTVTNPVSGAQMFYRLGQ